MQRILVRVILGWLAERAAAQGLAGSRSGAEVLAQRLGSALNLNLHFHVLVIDGTYSGQGTNPLSPPTFHEAAPLTDQDVAEVVVRLRQRIVTYLRRCGRILRDGHDDSAQPEPDEPLFAERCRLRAESRRARTQQLRGGRALRSRGWRGAPALTARGIVLRRRRFLATGQGSHRGGRS